MLIVCTSDVHRRLELLEKVRKEHPLADLYLDAGDSESYEFELEPFLSVKGNCDYKIKNKHRIIKLSEHSIFIFHGDGFYLSAESLAFLAKKHSCNIIIHGHTHIPYTTIYDGVYILNPGSLSSPRSTSGRTYALIKIEKQNIEIEIVGLDKW